MVPVTRRSVIAAGFGSLLAPKHRRRCVEEPIAPAEVPYAVLSLAAGQAIANSLITPVIWDTPAPSNLRGGMTYNHGTGFVTVPRNGLYLVSASVIFSTPPSGQVYLGPLVNGSNVNLSVVQNGLGPLSFSFPFVAQAGQTFGTWVDQTSGGVLPVQGGTLLNQFSVAYLAN